MLLYDTLHFVLGIDRNSLAFQDGYINANANLIPDSQQDCELVQSDENGFNFKRKFSTCDPRDVILSVSLQNFTVIRKFR